MALSKIGNGDFADVFDMGDGTVVKAFRRLQHTGGDVGDWIDEDALTTELYAAEARAYERLQQICDLALFTPVYYGRIDPCNLPDLTAHEQCKYVSGCGIRLERISGTAVKFGLQDRERKEEMRGVLERIETELAPGNVWDSSCFVPGSRQWFTLIDFAVWDNFDDCVEVLYEQGTFTRQQREQLRLKHGL